MGSTGDPPVPSGDSPDGLAATAQYHRTSFPRLPSDVPVGESPTGAGGSPALPSFKARPLRRFNVAPRNHVEAHSEADNLWMQWLPLLTALTNLIQKSASCILACHNLFANGRCWSGPFLFSITSAQE